jgi:hypothetical protein
LGKAFPKRRATRNKEREYASSGNRADIRKPLAEISLSGGRLTPGIVRVGNTVRRPAKGNAAFVHDLLLCLEDQDFPFAPRFLGRDEQGRDILSYLEGETWPDSGSGFSDDLLEQAARAIRRYHDVTAGSPLAQNHEIIAHHELGPHNTIFQGGHLVGFIDWNDAAPGTRLREPFQRRLPFCGCQPLGQPNRR